MLELPVYRDATVVVDPKRAFGLPLLVNGGARVEDLVDRFVAGDHLADITRELVRPHMTRVTVAPITTTVRGLSTELPVGPANGLDAPGVVSCDNIVSVPTTALGRQIGVLLADQEADLTTAIHAAFDLD